MAKASGPVVPTVPAPRGSFTMDLGQNLMDFAAAQPGDFMKILVSEVGAALSMDPVIYLRRKKRRARLRPILVEQHPDRLWREERAAGQDRARDFFPAGCPGKSFPEFDCAGGGQVFSELAWLTLQLRGSEDEVRDVGRRSSESCS
jgi:hypothetical protein